MITARSSFPAATHRFLLIAVAALGASVALIPRAAASGQKAYATPEAAISALVQAARDNDSTALLEIFGPGYESIFESDDTAADRKRRTEFLALYDEKHVVTFGADSRTLLVGHQAWPFPIPIVKSADGWIFDSAAGVDTMQKGRITTNERDVLKGLLTVVEAQRNYFSADRDGDGIREFAQQFRSTSGTRNGLFWNPESGEPPSPLGEFGAAASDEGYNLASIGYRGYQYRMLKSQSANAPGGRIVYITDGQQTGGFAVIASPVTYGQSGVHTFIVNHHGVVYWKDLGRDTANEAVRMDIFDPSDGWTRVSEKDLTR